MPGRCTGRMRQRNYVKVLSRACDPEFSADYFFQFLAVDELHDGQSADWNDKARPQNSDLIVDPRRAVANFIRRRNAIRTAGILTRKAAAYCSEINFRANSSLIHSAKLFEPAKKRFASSVRKWPLQQRLPRAGCLSNDHHIADNCAAGNRSRFHARAATAFEQPCNVIGQFSLFGLVHDRISHEGHKGTLRTRQRFSLCPL